MNQNKVEKGKEASLSTCSHSRTIDLLAISKLDQTLLQPSRARAKRSLPHLRQQEFCK